MAKFTMKGIDFMRKGSPFFWILLALPLWAAAPAAPQPPPVERLFAAADAPYDKIQTMSLKVERKLERGMQHQEERWEVSLRKPDLMRIDYQGPPERIVVANGDHYSEYIPEAKKALELNLSELDAKRQQEVYGALRPRVAIPGFRLGLAADMMTKMDFRYKDSQECDGRRCFYIEGEDRKPTRKSNGKMRIWIDEERQTLSRMEIYDGNKFVSSIENQSFKEVEKGIWFPTRIMVRNATADSLEKATYYVSKMVINQPLKDDIFQPSYAEGVKVVNAKTP